MANYPAVPATKLVAITPSDSTDLAALGVRALYVGGAGNLSLKAVDDSAAVTLSAVSAGSVIPVTVSRVMAATTATLIVGLI